MSQYVFTHICRSVSTISSINGFFLSLTCQGSPSAKLRIVWVPSRAPQHFRTYRTVPSRNDFEAFRRLSQPLKRTRISEYHEVHMGSLKALLKKCF